MAESVNNGTETLYYVTADVPDQLRELGRKAIKAFKVRNRFTHFEFFRLTQPRKGLCDTIEEACEFATFVLDEQAPIVTPALFAK